MPTKPTGNVRKHATGYSARVRIGPADRPSFELAARSDAAAEERAALLAELARRLRPVARPEEIQIILEAAGKARTDRGLHEAKDAAEQIIRGEASTAAGAMAPAFETFAKEWTSGGLHRKHPDHVREKDATRDLEVLRLYINPTIGPTKLADVTLDDCERVMSRLPATLSPASRRHIAQCMRRVLALAVYPGRHLTSNPIPREWMPKLPKGKRAKAYLFPVEDAKLLACAEVAIERRMAYGILAREGMRASELELLRWRDVDLDHGRVRLDVNKTDDPRAWALSPDVARALAWWKKQTKGEADDPVLRVRLADGARALRGNEKKPKTQPGDLRRAGVTRPELFERTATRQPIRLHDLRATFVTVSLANGKTEQWVTDRTGHATSAMIYTYKRAARTWADLDLGPLQPMDRLLPEMADEAPPSSEASTPTQSSGPRVGHGRAIVGQNSGRQADRNAARI